MTMSHLDSALWAASLIGHVALALVLVLKKKVIEFPVFFVFVTFSVLRTLLLFLLYRQATGHVYFLTYWITGAANYLFQVGLLVEITRIVLRPTGRWVLEARQSFLVWASVGLVVAAVVAFEMGPAQSKGLDLWDTRVNVFTALMICGFFLAMMTAANRLGLRWRSQVFAIGQGLFLWSAIAVLSDVAHTALGWKRDFIVFDHTQMVAYLVVVVYWAFRFWAPEPARAEISPEIRAYLVAAANRIQYDQANGDWNQP